MTESDFHREAIQRALRSLDGSDRAAVRLLTGFTDAELDDLGGFATDAAAAARKARR